MDQNSSIEAIHLASQYLAAAANSFIPKQADDSHTNMIWDAASRTIQTQEISEEGARIGLNLEYYSLDFLHPQHGEIASYPLANANHLDILNWIGREKYLLGIEQEYEYQMHYDLPYPKLDDHFNHPTVSKAELSSHSELRTLADTALADMSMVFDDLSEIRIWPHHFDTGALGSFNNVKDIKSIGFGLAIADSVCDEPYFYTAAYGKNGALDIFSAKPLVVGNWVTKNYMGAVLKAKGIDQETTVAFFKGAVNAYLNR